MMIEHKSQLVERVKEALINCEHSFDMGDTTEFYDKDGCVLMTATEYDYNNIRFSFDGEMDAQEFEMDIDEDMIDED